MNERHLGRRAITSVELIIALLILGLIAAIAIPRLGRANAGERKADGQTRHALRVLRTAIEMYHRDHGAWPGNGPDDPQAAPEHSGLLFLQQLAGATDAQGRAIEAPDRDHPFGPYIRGAFPACEFGPAAGSRDIFVISAAETPRARPDLSRFGWIYNRTTGAIIVNCAQVDDSGTRYDTY